MYKDILAAGRLQHFIVVYMNLVQAEWTQQV